MRSVIFIYLYWSVVTFDLIPSDVFCQMETSPALTPSSELVSSAPASVGGTGVAVGDQLTNLDLGSLLSVPGGNPPSAGLEVGIPVAGSGSNGFTMDLSLVSSGILTIDPSSVGTTLVTSTSTTLAKALDPLIMAANADIIHQHGLERTVGEVLTPQGSLNLDDVQTGILTALTIQGVSASVEPSVRHSLSSSNCLNLETSASLAVAPVPELLASPSKVVEVGVQGGAGPLLGCVEVLAPQEGGKVLTQFVFPSHNSSFRPHKDPELPVSPSSFLVRYHTVPLSHDLLCCEDIFTFVQLECIYSHSVFYTTLNYKTWGLWGKNTHTQKKRFKKN